MYSDWSSLTSQLQSLGTATQSVLAKLPPEDGKQVVASVVKTVAANLGITVPADAKPSQLQTEEEVNWCMEVICHGLCLPLVEHETIRDCVNIYCEWLFALLPNPKVCVPKPVLEDPNHYARKIITHFNHLFVPRKGEEAKLLHTLSDKSAKNRQADKDKATETIHRQAVVCHRVLRRVQELAQQSQIMERETWDTLLSFLLAINDALLSPPAVKDDVGDQLCERVLGVLYEIWLIACVKSFPGPPLWKTFREMCMNWRHRTGLVTQWTRVNLALTARLLGFMYGPGFPAMNIAKEDADLVPAEMTNECVAQSWYRFLHSLGNPVDLSRPGVVSQTQQFYQYAIVADSVIDPTHHPCLNSLPQIFFKAMKGVSAIVDAYLGLPKASQFIGLSRSSSTASGPASSSSLMQQSATYSSSGLAAAAAALMATSAVTGTLPDHPVSLSPLRPRCNSVLHLFGAWLFEASFIGSDLSTNNPSIEASVNGGPRRPGDLGPSRPASLSSAANSIGPESLDLPPALTPDRFESGRAEALGALCRIFCAKKTGEEILPVYLARFYMALQQGLTVGPDKVVSESLASILLNASNLLRIDLEGVNVLAPYIVSALEAVLPERDIRLAPSSVNRGDLRRAGVHLLQSMLSLPLHFTNMPIKDLVPGQNKPEANFSHLKPKLVNLLINALQVEIEPVNSQMLLGCLLLTVQDAAALEQADLQQSEGYSENSRNSGNLFAAASDTHSSISGHTSFSTDDQHDGRSDHDTNITDSAHALFVRATYLVCHRLISSWKSDLNTSLAALEMLAGMARINIPEQDALECKRAVKWLCDYIVTQCSRPPPAHSKDLHSSIVAAFQTCVTWLVHHPYLLSDKECLATVVEVAELGVSGTKSQHRASDQPTMKEDKHLNPASRRVRDAAEHLLSVVMEQVGYFPSACGAESLSTLLDESSLVQQCNSWNGEVMSPRDALQAFRFFVIDQSVVVAVLEEPLGNDQEPQPTVTLLIRCPATKSAWTLQLRHLPRHKSRNVRAMQSTGRPLPVTEPTTRQEFKPRFFPDSIDRIPLCAADRSIPAVESVAGDERAAMELDRLARLMEQQAVLEKEVVDKAEGDTTYNQESECVPPEPCTEFQTARLILSHLGFLSISSLKGAVDSPIPRLVALETDSAGFVQDLEMLDRLSPRTYDTILAFYVRSGQTSTSDIVANSQAGDLSPLYLELLAALGWPVGVASHPGWTGDMATSWKRGEEQGELDNQGAGPARFNGDTALLYWADVYSELAILVPSRLGGKENRPSSAQGAYFLIPENGPLATASAAERGQTMERAPTSLSLDLDNDQNGRRKVGRQQWGAVGAEYKVVVAWLESLEDADTFPLAELMQGTGSANECLVIFIHPLTSGLLRVKLTGQAGKMNLATPLVDGMVVSRRTIGPLTRQTALNMCRRRRLEAETYQPPHVRRKLKIQELVQKYRSHMTEAEFYAHLFSSPCP